MFQSLADFEARLADLPAPDGSAQELARARQAQLTKPPGALGRLEDIAVQLAGWSRAGTPSVCRPATLVFAGNHGVTAHAVSPYPSAVTAQMVANFSAGGAAINAITKTVGADLVVIPLDLDRPSADITISPALTEDELLRALNSGADAIPGDADALALGEMGIGNTTIAAALAAAAFGGTGADWVGPGTGLDTAGVRHKAAIVDTALARHAGSKSATHRLAQLGGRELAAIAGAVLAARHARIPVVLDGYVCTAAIAPLFADNPKIKEHCFAGHLSAEPAHSRLLEAMGLVPLLELGMRLGEGTGATLAIGVLRAAAATHNRMATFEEAAIANRSSE